ncbi:MAG: heme o synthase [Vicingaceae bacterium]
MQNTTQAQRVSASISIVKKISIALELFKVRLNLVVVISSALGYYIGMQSFNLLTFAVLVVGGFLVTGAANAMNQIIERDTDALMKRTSVRPLPTKRIPVQDAWILSAITGFAGILMLYFIVNPLTGILAGLSLFIYVVLYTPLKKITPFSVFVGAFPGAVPPMLGYVAATGSFGLEPGLLFAIQFMWQFPHFWAIAWIGNDEYQKAGFRMLPSSSGKSHYSAFIILLYSLVLIPVSISPVVFGLARPWAGIVIAILGVLFAIPAYRLHLNLKDKEAKTLMFASFLYLPLVLLTLVIDKLI